MAESDIEFDFEDSRRGVRLRVKGSKEVVDAYIEQYAPNLRDTFSREPTGPTPAQLNQPIQVANTSDLPERPKVNRVTDYVEQIMLSPWGSKGRTSSELIEAAKHHGIAITMSSLSGILYSLVQSGKLRRQRGEKDALWTYTPPLSWSLKET